MDALRAAHPVGAATHAGAHGDAPLWGGTVGTGASKVNGTSYWFDDIEPVYGELDELIESSGTMLRMVRRQQILQQAMRLLTEDLAFIPISEPFLLYAVGDDIDWQPRLDGAILAYDIRRNRNG